MKIIYKPEGKAREYAVLACNIYKGCQHGCKYCFGSQSLWIPRDEYYSAANPKKDVIDRLKKGCAQLNSDSPEILLSFIGDVYQPAEIKLGLTREVIKTLIDHNLKFTILTKGGTRACRDFDLLQGYDKGRFGTTLIFLNQKDADEWEPQAASISDRIEVIQKAHDKGISTWISVEPVIDPEQALRLIKELYPVVDHWKVGKINYHKEIEDKVDWIGFRKNVRDLLESFGADYYLKKSLTEL